ncbi:MAG: thioredoxin [Firmicutes bacterium]|nr:thioredoxin [Bacillota bacterium]
MVKYLKNENLKDVITDGIWIVDFYADWCGPCKMLGPVLEQLENNVLKVNVDSHEDLAKEFGVMSIPTICFFKGGELKHRKIGFINKTEIEDIINKL